MSLPHRTPLVSRRGRTAGAAVATVALLIAAWHPGLHRDAHATEPTKAPPAVPVRLATVQRKDVPLAMTGMGSVLPMASVTVRTRVDGQLEAVNFKEGQDVKAGQVLARLDARALQAALAQAQGTLARDNAQLTNARADLQRYTELQQQDAATRQQLDTQAALVRQLTATVQSDTAAVSAAQVQLSYATLAAPLSGRIGARLVDPGNIVHATDAAGLLVINQIDPIAVQFTLPESAFQAINTAVHGPAPLQVQAIDRTTHEVLATGELTLLNNQIDVTTGTIAMKGRFANPDHKLWPGQSVDARLVLGQQRNALTVPVAAVQRGPNGLFSYVVDAEGKARVQAIEVGSSEGDTAVVTKGLNAGDRVVTDGQFRLAPGTAVREAKEGGDAKGAAPGADKPAGAKAAETAKGGQGAAS